MGNPQDEKTDLTPRIEYSFLLLSTELRMGSATNSLLSGQKHRD